MKDSPEFIAAVHNRRSKRMEAIDRLAPDIRACVHDFGYNVVNAFLGIGVTKAKHIRHLVNTVLDEFSPTRASFSNQGISTRLNAVETAARTKADFKTVLKTAEATDEKPQ